MHATGNSCAQREPFCQSGSPGSEHYADALADWLAGRPRPLWMHQSDIAYHQKGTWELRPDTAR